MADALDDKRMIRVMLDAITRNTQSLKINSNSLRPNKFLGDPSEDIELWLEAFSRYSDHAQLTPQRRLSCLKALLGGAASVWLRSLDEDDDDDNVMLNNYDRFVVALRVQFELTASSKFQLRQRLRDRRQSPGEPVHAYATALIQLCQRLRVGDDEQLHNFVQGLLPLIKAHVLCMSPESLDEAIQYAAAKESAINSMSMGTASQVGSLTAPSPDPESPFLEVLRDIKTTLGDLKRQSKEPTASKADTAVVCQLCSAPNHVATQCTLFCSPQLPPGPPRRPRLPRHQVQCFACGQYGHYRRECRNIPPQAPGNDRGPTLPPAAGQH